MKSTVSEKQIPEGIDWDKPQLVKLISARKATKIVLTNGEHGGGAFCGVVVHMSDPHVNDPNSFVGEYSHSWIKDMFKPYNGTVELQN